jgi:hypothetical protein
MRQSCGPEGGEKFGGGDGRCGACFLKCLDGLA